MRYSLGEISMNDEFFDFCLDQIFVKKSVNSLKEDEMIGIANPAFTTLELPDFEPCFK